MNQRISSFRLPQETVSGLTAMAKRRERSVNYLVGVAVKRMLADDERLLQVVNEGVAQLDAGLGVPHAEMMRRSQVIIDRAKAKQTV